MNENPEDPLLARRLRDEPEDEAACIAAARAGGSRAQAWLVRRWQAPVYRYVRRMMGTDEDARDVAQDTLVKMLRKIHQYDDRYAFSTWVFGIARNTSIDELRRRKRRSWEEPGEVVDPAASPAQEASAGERAVLLEAALERLPPMYREVLVLYHFEHLKYAEIAHTLDIPIGTVMNRIFRARRKLRGIYEEMGGTP